jgi:hypothetical protein
MFIRRLRGGLARHPFGGFTSHPSDGPDLKFLVNSLGLFAVLLAGLTSNSFENLYSVPKNQFSG